MYFRCASAAVAALGSLCISCTVSASVVVQDFDVVETGPGLDGGLFAIIGSPSSEPGRTSWPVTVDVSALSLLPAEFALNIPGRSDEDDIVVAVSAEDLGGGRFAWSGRGTDCTAQLIGSTDALEGIFACPDGSFGFEGDLAHLQLVRYDSNPLEMDGGDEFAYPAAEEAEQAETLVEESDLIGSGTPDDTIDILVLYQDAVRTHTTNIYTLATQCVNSVRDALVNSTYSGPPIAKVRLVGTRRVSRTANGDAFADLGWLYVDPTVAALRNYYAADVVMYLTYYGGIIGGGYVYGVSTIPGSAAHLGDPRAPLPGPAYAPEAMAVVQYNTAVADTTMHAGPEPFTFAHEFGHILGANHDLADSANAYPLHPDAYGWWGVNSGKGQSYRTILSYRVGGCTSGGLSCSRIQNYSNPDIWYDWFRTGSSTAYNAWVIANYASTTAQYRTSIGRIFADGFEY